MRGVDSDVVSAFLADYRLFAPSIRAMYIFEDVILPARRYFLLGHRGVSRSPAAAAEAALLHAAPGARFSKLYHCWRLHFLMFALQAPLCSRFAQPFLPRPFISLAAAVVTVARFRQCFTSSAFPTPGVGMPATFPA